MTEVILKDDFDKYLAIQLDREEFRKEYDSLEPEYVIMQSIIDIRKNEGLTQKDLALRSGITQADISRLENGNCNPSIKTLKRLAKAMGKTLKIEFVDDIDN